MAWARLQNFRRRLSAFVWAASWASLAFLLVAAAVIHWAGDSSWLMTLLTFGPRWPLLLPLVPLAVGAIAVCRKALLPVLMSIGCALGPVMGFCVPWRSIADRQPEHALLLRIVSVNVDTGTDLAALFRFLKEVEPDVVAFQEGPFTASLVAELKDSSYFLAGGNDTFVASRHKIVDRVFSPKGASRQRSPSVRCDVATPAGVVHVNCLHLCSLRPGFDGIIKHGSGGIPELERATATRNEESRLTALFAEESDGPTVVLGDFNMTSDSTVFRRDWGNWQDAFSVRGFGLGYTFATNHIGLRIDHVLADKRHWHIRACRVGPDLRSQHRPVIADLSLIDTAARPAQPRPPE